MSTTINLPAVIEKGIKPKPSKREMIEALAIRHHAKAVKEWEEAVKKRDALQLEVAAEVHQLLKDQLITGVLGMDESPSFFEYGSGPEVRVVFNITIVPARIVKKLKDLQPQRHLHRREPQLCNSKSIVRAQIEGFFTQVGNRIDAMLKDEGMVKALDAMLKKIEKASESPATQPATTV